MILVTGANGYIGYELTKRLLTENKQVRAFCHKESNKIDKLKRKYGTQLEIQYGEIEKITEYPTLLKNIDIVYHLAGKITEEEDMEEINAIATQKLFKACLQYPIKRVVFFSSVAVYKTEKQVSIKTTKEPNNLYGETKLEAENIGLEYYQKEQLPLIILEPCSVYGKSKQGSMGKILNRAEKGFCIKIGKGNFKNTIIHIDDLITIAMEIVKKEQNIGKTWICGTETISIKEINRLLKTRKKIHELYIPYAIAMLLLKLPIQLSVKSTIKQLTRKTEYISNYPLPKSIKFEEYIKNGEKYDR